MSGASAPVLLVGCGKMGSALLAGWLARGSTSPVSVVEPAMPAGASFRGNPAVTIVADAAELSPAFNPDIVVFAVKPQGMDKIAPAYRRFAGGTVFLSIAAGRTIAF